MSSSSSENTAALVAEGWTQCQLQRPFAAWAAWQRALTHSPESSAAQQALTSVEKAPELPATARTPLRLRHPTDELRRERWDARLRDRNMADLAAFTEAFVNLTSDDPTDAAAWYNRGICLAWQGVNREAISALDEVVRLDAASNRDAAVDAWTVAEVLRQGAGAESLADDLTYACLFRCDDAAADELLAPRPELQAVPAPLDPGTGQPQFPGATAYTWLDRPAIAGEEPPARVADLPRVLAQVLRVPGTLRLSSPDPQSLEQVVTAATDRLGTRLQLIRREASPLRIALMDAALWTFRLPPGLDPEISAHLSRAAVEHFYENLWIHAARQGLGNRTPLEAARDTANGDPVACARLLAVVRLREQLGQRPLTAGLYQGYPFDRLRCRLGLELVDPSAVDADDMGCMDAERLRRRDLASLDDSRLAEAYESAASLRDDPTAARFGAEILRRGSHVSNTQSLIATLVREALKEGRPEEALRVLGTARGLNGGRDRRTFDVWAAEVHSRSGAPDAAAETYQKLLDQDADDASLALDGAETLIDNGYHQYALPLLQQARDRAARIGDAQIRQRAEDLFRLASHDDALESN